MKKILLLSFFVAHVFCSWAQERTVKGKVTSSEDGSALPGVNVVLKGTATGTVTDVSGNYSLSVPGSGGTLVFTFIGLESQEVEIGERSVIDAQMKQDVRQLTEVVVTAVGIEREKKNLGYATSTVNQDAILNARESNVVSALSAKVPGVVVTNSSGAAGASSFVMIRGPKTIRGDNQPLFVVDGVPIDNSQLSSGNPDDGRNGYLGSVANSNRAIDIPQHDIESITVLKGAAATALYGSQAGNGAVIITTKKGKRGAGLSTNVSAGVEVMKYNMMVPLQDEYAQGVSGNYRGPETGQALSWGPRISDLVYQPDANYAFDKNGRLVLRSDFPSGAPARAYNNVDDFFRTGYKQYYNIDLSGASDKTDYFFSAGYETTDGIIPNNSFDKINIGFNGGTKLGDKLSVRSSVKYINSGGVRIEQGSNTSGVMLGLVRTPPTYDNSYGYGQDAVDHPDAYTRSNGGQRNYRGGGGYDNPFWTVNNNPLEDDVNRIIGKIELDYHPVKWLSVKYRVGLDNYSDYRSQYFAINSRTVPAGRVTENTFLSQKFNEDLMLFLNKDFSEDIKMNVTLGHNRRSTRLDQNYIQGDNLTIPNFYDMSNSGSVFTRKLNENSKDQALYAMGEISFRDYLFVTLTGRNEWSTTLPASNNSFFYPSAMASFVFTDAFGLANNTVSFGKVRASWAKVGLGSPFLYATNTYFTTATIGDGWTEGITFPFNGVSSFQKSITLGDPGLEPESNSELEFGVELKFLNNRVGLDLTYYDRKSEGLIFPVPIAASSGYEFLLTNAGSITNKGIEMLIEATPVQSATGFTWDVGVNFAKNKNEVTELAEGVDNVFLGGFTGANIRAEAGKPYGSIFGFGFYRDASGAVVIGADGFPIIDPNERGFGSAQPDWTMGIRNSFSYKGISLSALIDIRQGGKMWNGTRGALYYFGTHEETEIRGQTRVFEGNVATYDEDDNLVLDESGVPVTAGANTQQVTLDENWLAFGDANGFFGNNSEDFIEKTDWVRLREVTIGYSLPASILSKTPFNKVNITFSGRNLWLSTPYKGVDPETSLAGSRNEQGMDYFNMPNTKSYHLGVQVSF